MKPQDESRPDRDETALEHQDVSPLQEQADVWSPLEPMIEKAAPVDA